MDQTRGEKKSGPHTNYDEKEKEVICQISNASIWQKQKWRLCNEQLLNAPRCALLPREFKFHPYWIPAVK